MYMRACARVCICIRFYLDVPPLGYVSVRAAVSGTLEPLKDTRTHNPQMVRIGAHAHTYIYICLYKSGYPTTRKIPHTRHKAFLWTAEREARLVYGISRNWYEAGLRLTGQEARRVPDTGYPTTHEMSRTRYEAFPRMTGQAARLVPDAGYSVTGTKPARA